MRVLILGSGAKDHAIAWWFSKSNLVSEIFCAPGNPETALYASNLPGLNLNNPDEVYLACVENKISLVVVGTEGPLFTGVIPYLNRHGIRTFGANEDALKLEGDRYFARSFTDRHNIPTPRRNLFRDKDALSKFLKRHGGIHFVLKPNSLAYSRQMLDSADPDELLAHADDFFALGPVLLEEHVSGLHITSTVLLDKEGYFALPLTADYMYTTEKDGIPTGGMGSICPIPLGEDILSKVREVIMEPTVYGMKVEGLSYKGVMTLSMVIKDDGVPCLVDYHVRFHDPATEAMATIVKNDIGELMIKMDENKLSECSLELNGESSVAITIASRGYPQNPETGKKVEPVNPIFLYNTYDSGAYVFMGAVKGQDHKSLVTTGGRNFAVVGHGTNIKEANENAYRRLGEIKFDGAWHREDIGNRFFYKNELNENA